MSRLEDAGLYVRTDVLVESPGLLLVSFFWLVGVVAQLTLTSCGTGDTDNRPEERHEQ